MHGALLSAVENRVAAYELIAGTARWADWYLFGAADGGPAGEELAAYRKQLAPIDPITAVARNRAPVMWQFGEDDFYTPRQNFIGLYAAAAEKTTRINTYGAQHAMDKPIIRRDRETWPRERLGLSHEDGDATNTH
jgi:pimeloyl-ACP methyl ester carboxylesterase